MKTRLSLLLCALALLAGLPAFGQSTLDGRRVTAPIPIARLGTEGNQYASGSWTGTAAFPGAGIGYDGVSVGWVLQGILPPAKACSSSNISSLSGTATVDTVSLGAGDEVLLTGQTTASQNGPWVVESGSWVRPFGWTSGQAMKPGEVIWVYAGSANGPAWWYLSGTSAVTVDTTSTTWDEVSAQLPAFGAAGSGHSAGILPDPGSTSHSTAWYVFGDDGYFHQVVAGSNITLTYASSAPGSSVTITASGGGSGINPADYISGLVPAYVSSTEVEVSTGSAYNPNTAASQTVSSAITDNYSYGSSSTLVINGSNNEEVTDAAHTFTANDIGSTIDITAGTSWTTGNYIILSVSGGAAYLNKSPSAAGNSHDGAYTLKLTPSMIYGIFLSGTSSIAIQGPLEFVDLAIDATNNEKVTSASYSFTSADVGQYIDITAGTGWTDGYYLISSVSGGAAILSSSPSAAGNGNKATANMSMIPYSGSVGNYQGTASESLDGNTYRYLGAALTNSSNQFVGFYTDGHSYYYQGGIVINAHSTSTQFSVLVGGDSTTAAVVSCAGLVPPGSSVAYLIPVEQDTNGDTLYLGNSSFPPNTSTGAAMLSIVQANGTPVQLPLVNQTFDYAASNNFGTDIMAIWDDGYLMVR